MIHKFVGQLINQSKGMRSALWSVEEELTMPPYYPVSDEVSEVWQRVKKSHRELRYSLQILADILPDEDLTDPS